MEELETIFPLNQASIFLLTLSFYLPIAQYIMHDVMHNYKAYLDFWKLKKKGELLITTNNNVLVAAMTISSFTSLFVLILLKKIAVFAQSTTQLLVGNLRTPLQREYTIQNILSSYKAAHNAEVLSLSGSSELCSRRFILSTAACRDAGNGLGILLDNLAW